LAVCAKSVRDERNGRLICGSTRRFIAMNLRATRSKKGISEVLATVILIAITLVAGVAIAGFAFGLFNSLGSTANVSVGATPTCSLGASTCTLVVSNSGKAAGSITACNIGVATTGNLGDATVFATASGALTSVTIPSGSTLYLVCSFSALPQGGTAGTHVSGTITVNGNLVSWAGIYVA
jgi:flagellin-like protein